jgi:hypothetical protein
MNFPIGYGMNLEQSQPATAEPEPQEPVQETAEQAIEEVVTPKPKRKRARVTGGRLAADDPSTVANEAWTES